MVIDGGEGGLGGGVVYVCFSGGGICLDGNAGIGKNATYLMGIAGFWT